MGHSKASTRFTRLKWRRAFSNWEQKAARWIELIRAGYDPNQPRVPAGSREGGRWASQGGSTRVAQANSNKPKKPADTNPTKPKPTGNDRGPNPKSPKLKLPVSGKPSRGGPQLEQPPQLPKKKPPTQKERIAHARNAARWLTIAVAGRHLRAAAILASAIEETGWLDEFRGFIQSAFDAPKSLEQLQRDALEPEPGYDIHHIVEQTAARNFGFQDSRINAPENLVRIPRIKHWELNRWYSRKNDDFGDQSPRDYLRDKDWDERMRVGIKALKDHGVMKK